MAPHTPFPHGSAACAAADPADLITLLAPSQPDATKLARIVTDLSHLPGLQVFVPASSA
ncbi:hypothetical protein P775_24070 [Puniceibacterium antarcticum]|uniref:Uncharacterized protein n=1 Tax=Puniceibacterium antarcticum TaxID=1206336 RepID=A0A2G8R7Z0_9RHOB|nr:hypothetical protein P775_24070 [Puniceibacterium antarcticum]